MQRTLSDPAEQQRLNAVWRQQYMKDSDMAPRSPSSAPHLNGHAQSADAVQRVLAQVNAPQSLASTPESSTPLPVIAPVPQGVTKTGMVTTTRNTSTVARMLLMQGLSNADVFATLQEEFDLPDSRRGYPAWYRAQLTKQGVLTGPSATSHTRQSPMAPQKTEAVPMTLEQQVTKYSEMMVRCTAELDAVRLQRGGLAAAHTSYCESMGLTTPEEQVTSPVCAALRAADERLVALQGELTEAQRQHVAFTAALKAYTKVMDPAPPAPTPETQDVKPPKPVSGKASSKPAAVKVPAPPSA